MTKLPPLAGIDTGEGLARVDRDQAFYLKLLFKFHDQQRDVVARVRRLLSESGDVRAAEREVHTLKGIAAAIGAKELSKAARELEDGIRAAADASRCRPLIDELDRRLAEVVGAIAGIDHLRPMPAVVASSLDRNQLAVLIDEARRLCAAFDVEAEGPAKRLRGALVGTPWAERARRIQELAVGYDYDAARRELEVLAREIYDGKC